MRIAAISDLHLGGKDRIDRFYRVRRSENRLIQLLDKLEESVDLIVLLGDIFETLKGPGPGTSRQELNRAIEAYPALTSRFLRDKRYLLIQGNHDHITRRALGAREFYEAKGSERVLFLHGHQLTWLERNEARFSRLGVWSGGLLERARVPINAISDRNRGVEKVGERPWFEKRAMDFAKQRGASVVVTGHTHVAGRLELSGGIYLNTGTCLGGRAEYVLIDTERHEYRSVVET